LNNASSPVNAITSRPPRRSSGPSLAAIFTLYWPRSLPNGSLRQPDGIRHRNSEREYLAKLVLATRDSPHWLKSRDGATRRQLSLQ
jgi:hypothetical protein